MPAYLIAHVEVTDPAGYQEYIAGAPATVAAHGGRYIVRGGTTELLEGDTDLHRVVVLEFPSVDKLKDWYDCAEYRSLREIRQRTSKSTLVLVDGV